MAIRPQNRFPRLVVVSPQDKQPRKQPAGLRWWGPPRRLAPPQPSQTPKALAHRKRMTVMPYLPRSVWFVVSSVLWSFLRSYFVTEAARRPGDNVVSFRSQAAQKRSFRQAVAEQGFANKKASGSVRWSSECEVTPKEGGRG